MKNCLNVLLVISMLFISDFVSAQSSKKVNMKKPESVSLVFMQRFIQFEFESAKSLTTEESKQIFSLLEMAMSSMEEEEMKKAKEEAKTKAKNLIKAKCAVTKDEAICTFCCDENKQPVADSELKLKKVKGKWYVHMSKEDMMNDQENMGEAPLDGE